MLSFTEQSFYVSPWVKETRNNIYQLMSLIHLHSTDSLISDEKLGF